MGQWQGSNSQAYQYGPPATPFQFWGSPIYTASDGRLWCPGFDGETFATNPWDYIKFGAVYGTNTGGAAPDRTPGICRVNVGKGYEIDTKKPIGGHGSRNTTNGVHPAGATSTKGNKMPFEIEFTVWTPEQLRQFNVMWTYFVPQAGKSNPIAVDASYPSFVTHGIKAIQFVSGEGFSVGAGRIGTFKAYAVEYQPPPKGTTPSSAVNTPTQALGTIYSPAAPALPGSNSADTAPR